MSAPSGRTWQSLCAKGLENRPQGTKRSFVNDPTMEAHGESMVRKLKSCLPRLPADGCRSDSSWSLWSALWNPVVFLEEDRTPTLISKTLKFVHVRSLRISKHTLWQRCNLSSTFIAHLHSWASMSFDMPTPANR